MLRFWKQKLHLTNLLCFDLPKIERWSGMVAHCVQALESYLPKNITEMLNLKQNEEQFYHEGKLVNLITFSFIRDLQWNNTKKEVDILPESVFKYQRIISLLVAMWQIRCKWAAYKMKKQQERNLSCASETL